MPIIGKPFLIVSCIDSLDDVAAANDDDTDGIIILRGISVLVIVVAFLLAVVRVLTAVVAVVVVVVDFRVDNGREKSSRLGMRRAVIELQDRRNVIIFDYSLMRWCYLFFVLIHHEF